MVQTKLDCEPAVSVQLKVGVAPSRLEPNIPPQVVLLEQALQSPMFPPSTAAEQPDRIPTHCCRVGRAPPLPAHAVTAALQVVPEAVPVQAEPLQVWPIGQRDQHRLVPGCCTSDEVQRLHCPLLQPFGQLVHQALPALAWQISPAVQSSITSQPVHTRLAVVHEELAPVQCLKQRFLSAFAPQAVLSH